jgi:paraquat-inducible protein B
VRHKDVDIGTVEKVTLTPDMGRVLVQARMHRSVADHLTEGVRFWIVRPRVGIGGISGLSTLVSGSYIEMYPGDGPPERNFVGLDEPPTLQPEAPGHSFTLRAADLGQIAEGSHDFLSRRAGGRSRRFRAGSEFQADRDLCVRACTLRASGASGDAFLEFRRRGYVARHAGAALSGRVLQQLLSGGVTFDTPDSALDGTPSQEGSVFRLYANQSDASRGSTRTDAGLPHPVPGRRSSWTRQRGRSCRACEVGQVTDSKLQYDDTTNTTQMLATIQIDPTRLEIVHRACRCQRGAHRRAARAHRALVAHGLRAQLQTANFLTGNQVVSLDLVRDAPAARIEHVDGFYELPSVSSSDLSAILTSVKSVLHHIDSATAGPELGHAIKELDRTLSNLDQVTHDVEPQIKPLLESLRETADATQRTLQAADSTCWAGAPRATR